MCFIIIIKGPIFSQPLGLFCPADHIFQNQVNGCKFLLALFSLRILRTKLLFENNNFDVLERIAEIHSYVKFF